jgi:hypothetical protein
MVTSIIGLKLGLEERNFISIVFLNKFGNFYGLVSALVGKCLILIFPMVAYQYIQKYIDTIFLKKTYWSLYVIIMIITIITTLRIDINNIMEIINKL